MKFAVAMLTIASLGATLAVASPGEKNKSSKESTVSTDTGNKKQHKKKEKKSAADKSGDTTTQPETR